MKMCEHSFSLSFVNTFSFKSHMGISIFGRAVVHFFFLYWCFKNEKNVSAIEFLNFHNKISLGYCNGQIKIFDIESDKLCGTFNEHTKAVKKISFNQICNQCVSISDSKGFVWDPLTFQKLFLIEPFEGYTLQEAMFVPWYYKFIIQTSDNRLSIWHSKKGYLIKTFQGVELLGDIINSFSFKKNGSAMVVCGDSNKLPYIVMPSWSLQVIILPDKYNKLKFIEFVTHPSNNGESNLVAFITYQDDIVLFDLIRGTILTVGQMNLDYCDSLEINTSGKHLFCLTGKGNICIFYNEVWSDQDIIIPKDVISEESCHTAHDSYSKCSNMKNKDILNVIYSLGQFSSDLRPFMWKRILSLPINTVAYRDLCRKGFHNSFTNVMKCPFIPIDLHFPVLRLVSNLAFWCPIFQFTNYLPLMVLRFSKLFKFSPLLAFEVVATILVNYCHNWFSDYPLVSQDITNYIEYVIKRFELDLWNHFNKFDIRNTTYICPVMETLFAEVLTESDWLVLWDNVLTNKTDFLTLAIAAFYIVNKNQFLSHKSKAELEFAIHNPVSTDIQVLTKKTREIASCLMFDRNFHDFAPLAKGNTYQILTNSMELGKVITLETISNAESALVKEKIMKLHDKSLEEQSD